MNKGVFALSLVALAAFGASGSEAKVTELTNYKGIQLEYKGRTLCAPYTTQENFGCKYATYRKMDNGVRCYDAGLLKPHNSGCLVNGEYTANCGSYKHTADNCDGVLEGDTAFKCKNGEASEEKYYSECKKYDCHEQEYENCKKATAKDEDLSIKLGKVCYTNYVKVTGVIKEDGSISEEDISSYKKKCGSIGGVSVKVCDNGSQETYYSSCNACDTSQYHDCLKGKDSGKKNASGSTCYLYGAGNETKINGKYIENGEYQKNTKYTYTPSSCATANGELGECRDVCVHGIKNNLCECNLPDTPEEPDNPDNPETNTCDECNSSFWCSFFKRH